MSTQQGKIEGRAERVAAELLDKYGVPGTYERAVTVVALAYLKGGRDQLSWAHYMLTDGEDAA